MSSPIPRFLALFLWVAVSASQVRAEAPLRLIPFPKEVLPAEGNFPIDVPTSIAISPQLREPATSLLRQELARVRLPEPTLSPLPSSGLFLLQWTAGENGKAPALPPLPQDNPEAYCMVVAPQGLSLGAATPAGAFHGIQTLRQLIRANRQENHLPCLTLRDWPSLRWRCFQDDLTRGPSTFLEALNRELDLGAFFKHNLFTYYMEHQFAWAKHPSIGPPGGSLTPAELRSLVAHAGDLQLAILGNQQSFGHFGHILEHPEYAALRETPNILCPVNEGSYRLLDDLYSEVIPLLPLPFFNVCCDETEGLGDGPSKAQAQAIGVGGVYARHVRRVHDLLKDRYGKRMMMWGDIILQHPDHLPEIPTDTILLTWGYGPRASFDDQILPFAQSGYEFFVCPGVNNWNRILPAFADSLTNICNFVRDGVRHGALGMLNTAWDDDGETLNAPNWPGYAWGAECAWNASVTTPEDFNRRLGAVLFGERDDHFGQALDLLAQTHSLPGMQGMRSSRFWQLDLTHQQSTAAQAARLLGLVRPAIDHLLACQKDATANADLLDFFIFGARRMELIAQRLLDTAAAAEAYQAACESPPGQSEPYLRQAEAAIHSLRNAHAALAVQFEELWRRENRPYALDRVMGRFANAIATYDGLLEKLASAQTASSQGDPIPSARQIGLEFLEPGARRTRPDRVIPTPLEPQASWLAPAASHRLGIGIDTGASDRTELPLELDLRLPPELTSRPVRAFLLLDNGPPVELPAQLDPPGQRLVLLLAPPLPKHHQATVAVYLGLPAPPAPPPGAVTTSSAADGMKWLENDRLRLLLGPEGAHLYRWEVKALANRDLTVPGEESWLGFADLGGERRTAKNTLVCLSAGPALVRYRCTDDSGIEKTVSLYAGTSWAEIALNEAASFFWAYDDPKNFAADGPTPGRYLFSTGATGEVGRQAAGVGAQVKAANALWGIKYVPGQLALGLATPGAAVRHVIAPGSGAGGVGIEGPQGAARFLLFGGALEEDPASRMTRLVQTLDPERPPVVTVYALQARNP